MTEDLKVVRDPNRIKVGIEDTRSKILEILKHEDLTIKEIADKLGKDESTVYRHIKKLERNDFIEPVEDDGKATPYSRTAHTIFLDPEYMDYEEKLSCIIDWDLDFTVEDLVKMEELGYKNDRSEELIDEIYELFSILDKKLGKVFENTDGEIEETNTMVLLRSKLLTYLLLICKDDDCEEKFDKIFSRFELDESKGDDNKE